MAGTGITCNAEAQTSTPLVNKTPVLPWHEANREQSREGLASNEKSPAVTRKDRVHTRSFQGYGWGLSLLNE